MPVSQGWWTEKPNHLVDTPVVLAQPFRAAPKGTTGRVREIVPSGGKNNRSVVSWGVKVVFDKHPRLTIPSAVFSKTEYETHVRVYDAN